MNFLKNIAHFFPLCHFRGLYGKQTLLKKNIIAIFSEGQHFFLLFYLSFIEFILFMDSCKRGKFTLLIESEQQLPTNAFLHFR